MDGRAEYEIYWRLLRFLTAYGWRILCASPPAGTDFRYRKCLLPRRDLKDKQERGLRDEVDCSAYRDGTLLLIEAKPLLSHSVAVANALGEPDVLKLRRLLNSYPPQDMRNALKKGLGLSLPVTVVGGALAVGAIDAQIPEDMSVLLFTQDLSKVFPRGPAGEALPLSEP